jgi:hypothetical protein
MKGKTVTLTGPVEGAVEGTVEGAVEGAVEEEEHETRPRPRINAVKSRIMIVPSIFRPTGSEGHVERAVRDELRVSRRSYSAR